MKNINLKESQWFSGPTSLIKVTPRVSLAPWFLFLLSHFNRQPMAVESTGNQCKPGIFLLRTCAQVKTLHIHRDLHCLSDEVRLALLPEQNLLEQQYFPYCHSSPLKSFSFAAIGAYRACWKRLPWFGQAVSSTALASPGHQLCLRCRAPRTRIPPTSKCPGALGAVCYQGICWLVFPSVPSSTESAVSWLIEDVAPLTDGIFSIFNY